MTPPTSSPVLRRLRHEDSTPTFTAPSPNDPRIASRDLWREAFRAVRAETERRAAPLCAEDQTVHSMPDASPAKWHRAHSTWFFEQFLLIAHLPGYRVFDERFAYLFNSYYVAAGPRHARPRRGLLTRPDCEQIAAYRAHVDAAVEHLLAGAKNSELSQILRILEIGLHHEQQHQELLLTDILHAFAGNPISPVYDAAWPAPQAHAWSSEFVELPSGIHTIGFVGEGYRFDNEGPQHEVEITEPFYMGVYPVTRGQFGVFVKDVDYKTEAETDGRGGWGGPNCWLGIMT